MRHVRVGPPGPSRRFSGARLAERSVAVEQLCRLAWPGQGSVFLSREAGERMCLRFSVRPGAGDVRPLRLDRQRPWAGDGARVFRARSGVTVATRAPGHRE